MECSLFRSCSGFLSLGRTLFLLEHFKHAPGHQKTAEHVDRRQRHGQPIPAGNRLELFLGAAIGAITFSGSVIAFGKLSGKYKFRLFQGAPVVFSGQHMLNLILGIATVACGLWFMATQSWTAFYLMLALSFILGVLIIIPIGGADMPVVVSMLNSYSGWAAACSARPRAAAPTMRPSS